MINKLNILIAGVGGQGTVLMGELLGQAAVKDGLNVKGCEIIGGAQRGGPVTSIIRLGSDCRTPTIPLGKGDILIGLEPSEALRAINYMSKSSTIILNTRPIRSVSTLLGLGHNSSNEDITKLLQGNSCRIVKLDAVALAMEAGNGRMANMVMIGAAFGTGLLPIKTDTFKGIIESTFREKDRKTNMKAFDLGYEASHLN